MVDSNTTIPILKLSIRSDIFYRDITIHLTKRSLFLIFWLGLGTVLLYEIISVWILFLFHKYHHRPTTLTRTTETTDEEEGNGLSVEPLPWISRREPPQEPNRLIVFFWGVSTAYAIFYSFEVVFLYINDRWYQLLGIQVLLTLTDIFTWIHLCATAKYGMAFCYPLTQTCSGIKLLHLLFNIMLESKKSITSARHWMFLLEDSTYLWCARYWLLAQPRKLLTMKGIALLLLGAASCALLIHNLTSMNRITRL
jgi:hypothetical protein